MAQCISGTVLPTAKEIDVQLCTKKEYIVLLLWCGVCSAVCPRGVLKLKTRLQAESILMILLGNDFKLMDLITNK
jgi:ferredoxin